jgi:disulfide bond formation protein DsbB
MTIDTVSTFLAVGALVLLACVTAVWVVRLVAIVSARGRRLYDSIRLSVEGQGLRLAWLMAVIAMVGSLYYSEVAGFPPCEYCWYQRIAMYPLVVILGIAILRRDTGVRRYVLPLAISGGFISMYHYGVERFPDIQVGECSAQIPCSQVWVWKFDLVSIAFMAFVCFSVIVTVLLLDRGPAVAAGAGPDLPRPPEEPTP